MKQKPLILTLIHALLFTFLFYQQVIGINLLIFEIASIASILFILKPQLKTVISITVLVGTLLSGIFTVVYYSHFAIFINICSYILLSGIWVYPQAKSLVTPAISCIANMFLAIGRFYQSFGSIKGKNRGLRIFFNIIKIGILPLIILFIFILMYNASNPIFGKYVSQFTEWSSNYIGDFFTNLNFGLMGVFILGLWISVFSFFQVRSKTILEYEENGSDEIIRKRKRNEIFKPKITALKAELKSAILLLIMLNALLLFINIIDIYWVWFNFEWEGEYLKQFVHEGTYLLILSILISIGIVLFYFRGNLNFYKKNKTLKILSYAWMSQNAILTLSVAIRNFWYIKYFALAYKRIGVLFFLVLTLYGIYTVIVKVRDKKSSFYIVRKNKYAAYIILIVMALFNWDIIIAKYNFNHYNTSFVHYNFLARLSYKTLPYLEKSNEELGQIDKVQAELFPFEEKYMSSNKYQKRIEKRKQKFFEKWEKKSWKSWNLSESIAYKTLKAKSK